MRGITLTALAVAGAVAQSDKYTASQVASVDAAQATARTTHKTSNVKGKAFDRFITIWFENTDYGKAKGDKNLAWLATQGITLSNYFGVTHPSEPNYCASHGGDNFGMDNDDFHQIPANISTVTALLEDKGITWGSYQEDMPYTGYEGYQWVNQETQANDYVRKHNPPVLYDRNTIAERLTYQKNFTMFDYDLAHQKLPQWFFVTPNMTDDGHDSSVTVAGEWARSWLTPLLNNEYFMDRTLILLTFDENHTYQKVNKVFSILLGGAVPNQLRGTTDDRFYVRVFLLTIPYFHLNLTPSAEPLQRDQHCRGQLGPPHPRPMGRRCKCVQLRCSEDWRRLQTQPRCDRPQPDLVLQLFVRRPTEYWL